MRYFIGLMSGTSLDGVDGVLVDFGVTPPVVLAEAFCEFPPALKQAFLDLQQAGDDEIHREALAANGLAQLYASCIQPLLDATQISVADICAVGAHGQTIRHQPKLYDGIGYTRQTQHPALLAELCGIDVIADFRSRDIAAGGQGAPLVPAFHQALFKHNDEFRAVCNIGGMANLSILSTDTGAPVVGFDCGPGNVLMDLWIQSQRQLPYDKNGAWAAQGKVHESLLQACLAEPFFALPPPKSTGRDLFHAHWLQEKLALAPSVSPVDVQATLTALTAHSIAESLKRFAPHTERLLVCGGGAYNPVLLQHLQTTLPHCKIDTTADHGVPAHQVEAFAFAWLARQFCLGRNGNLPIVTGAEGGRILGALYPH